MQRKTTTLSLLLFAGLVSGCSFSFSTNGGSDVPATKYAYSDPAPATTSSGVTRKPITKRAEPAAPASKPADPQRIPVASEPQRTEPTREPTRTEPTRQPTRTEPTREPKRTEPTREPTRTEPTREPKRTEPTRTEPTREPTRTEPTRTPTPAPTRTSRDAKAFKRPIGPVQPSNPIPTSAALDRTITRSAR